MRPYRYSPPPEVVPLIREWAKSRREGRRGRPYAKEICHRLGISDTTLRKVARSLP